MIIANGDIKEGKGSGRRLLLVGLTNINMARLVKGEPIHIRPEVHGPGVPSGWEILIFTGETEVSMEAELRRMGVLKGTLIKPSPNLGLSDDT